LPKPLTSNSPFDFKPVMVGQLGGVDSSAPAYSDSLSLEVRNPMHHTRGDNLSNPVARVDWSALVKYEAGIPAREYQKAYLAAMKDSVPPSSDDSSTVIDLWLEGEGEGSALRKKFLSATASHLEIDKSNVLLLLRHILHSQLRLASLDISSQPSALMKPLQNLKSELTEMQKLLRIRELVLLKQPQPSMELALNHLLLGAVVTQANKIEHYSESLKPTTEPLRIINPLINNSQELLAQPARYTTETSLLATLAARATQDLESQKIPAPLLAKVAGTDWLVTILGTYLNDKSLIDAISVMETLLSHIEAISQARKEPIEVSLWHVLLYLLSGTGLAIFMKNHASNPFNADQVKNADVNSLFDPLTLADSNPSSAPISAIVPVVSSNSTQSANHTALATPSAPALTNSPIYLPSVEASSSASSTPSASGSNALRPSETNSATPSASGTNALSLSETNSATLSASAVPAMSSNSPSQTGSGSSSPSANPSSPSSITSLSQSASNTASASSSMALALPSPTTSPSASSSLLPILPLPNDTWALAFGGIEPDQGYRMALLPDGNMRVMGTTFSYGAGGPDVYVAQLAKDGTLGQLTTLGGEANDEGFGLAPREDGGFIVTGSTQNAGDFSGDILIANFLANGTFSSALAYGEISTDVGNDIIPLSNGDFAVIGSSSSFSAGSTDFLIMTLHQNCSVKWAKIIGASKSEVGNAIALLPNGNLVATGYTNSFGSGGRDIVLLQLSSDGDIVQATALGGKADDIGYAIAARSDNSFVVVGVTQSFSLGDQDVFVAEFFSNHTARWSKIFGNSAHNSGLGLTRDLAGNNFIMGATLKLGTGNQDIFLAKLTADGSLKWANTYGGGASEIGRALALSESGNITLAGGTQSTGAGSTDILVAQLTAEGNFRFNHSFIQPFEAGVIHDITPNSSDIMSALSASPWNFMTKPWDPLINASISPVLTQIASSENSSSLGRRLAKRAPNPWTSLPRNPYENELLAEQTSSPAIALGSSSSSNIATVTVALTGFCLLMLILWRWAKSGQINRPAIRVGTAMRTASAFRGHHELLLAGGKSSTSLSGQKVNQRDYSA